MAGAGIGAVVIVTGVALCARFRAITSKPRWVMSAAVFVLLLGTIFMEMPSLGFEFVPRVDNSQVIATVEMPVGTSLPATDAVVKRVENACAGIPEVDSVFTTVGATTASFGNMGETGTNYGEVSAALTPRESVADRVLRFLHIGAPLRVRSDEKIAQEIREKVSNIPGGRITVAVSGGLGNEESPIEIELTGEDTRELNSVAQRVKAIVASTDGTLNTDVSWKVGSPEVKADIDKGKAANLGLSVAQIASAMRTSVTGSTDTRFREDGKEYDIRVRLRKFDRYSQSDVGRLVVASKDGAPVYLQDVANISSGSGPTKIERKNRQRKISVTADLAPGYYVGNLQQQLAVKLADVPLGSVRLHWAGQVEQLTETGWNMGGALILSILLVYMLMAALFESFLNPLVIMFSVPMALVGAILALALAGESLSMVSMIGMIMLMGLVTKNAILLVDYTNTLRQRGMDRDAAILEAGPTRLRPILMTTLAMIFGMAPTALKLGRGSELRAPMAICVIGGLIISTLLTLVMIPTLYATMDDIVTWRRSKKTAGQNPLSPGGRGPG
jgi:HAE1 family hydrophobic/amphiphilic exporter-1